MSTATESKPAVAQPALAPVRPKPATTFTAREFDQDLARAKRAAAEGPVIITDRGKPAHVLMSYEAYEALPKPEPEKGRSALEVIREILAQPGMEGVGEIELELPPRGPIGEPARFD